MRSGGGKSKGSSFERLICKQLSLWASNGAQEDVFWRSALSGGRSTVAHAKGKRLAAQAGDISCINPMGHTFISHFMCECKHYKNLKIQGLITGTGNLVEFWMTAKTEAKRYDKFPLLIAKQNQMPIFVCLSGLGVATLELDNHIFLTHHFIDLHIILFDQYLTHAIPPSE